MATTTAAESRAPLSADAILARLSGRSVRCYHCGEWFRSAARAQSASCPTCYAQVHVPDIHVKDAHWGGPLMTAGRLTVHRRGIARAKVVVACHGITVQGRLEGRVYCDGPVILGRESIFRGSLNARSVQIEPGAVIEGGPFTIPDEPIGRVDLPRSGRSSAAANAGPGSGAAPAATPAPADAAS